MIKGGTWAGAVEQLEKLKFAPLYARSPERKSKGLSRLINKGAFKWPEPRDPIGIREIFDPESNSSTEETVRQLTLPMDD